ncbi:MAG: DUF1549 and DUF1553 domain-containing protein [Planctomycetia bacterium]|nr:DUF1549 and DUF1553 domain-containing protein [Planctomycetia bacterium]
MGATGIALVQPGKHTTAAELAPAAASPAAATRVIPRSAAGSSVTEQDIVTFINEQIRAGWKDGGINPSAAATDAEWCRRVYLDIIGRLPTVEETDAFLRSGGPEKRLRLVSLLMGETVSSNSNNAKDAAAAERYLEEYARNWSTIYSILLVGRPPAGNNNREMVNRDGMLAYLRGSLLRNKPWDKIVEEIVGAQGTTKPGSPNFNGATNFLVNKLQENAAEATAKTAKYFLGIQVQCTQCHNHPFNDWKQDQFWGLNAFFRQTKAKTARDGRAIDYVTLENEDYAGEGSNPKEAEIYFELRNGELRVAYPTFVDGTKIKNSGYVNEVDRRTELSKLVVKHENFGKAMVNRMWGHFFGYGFTKPVDDMGPHNPVSHPELLDRMGSEFTARGHNIKELIKWITLSEAYGLSSKSTPKNKKDDPSLGEKPKFSHFYLRQMQAEELYESLLAATKAASEGSAEEQQAKKDAWLRQFTVTFGNDEGDEATTFNGTIPQVLMMMNGDLTKTALASNFMTQLTASNMSLKEKVDFLYMATLSRKPTSQEAAVALSAREANAGGVLQDVFWALLNSNEFIFNH